MSRMYQERTRKEDQDKNEKIVLKELGKQEYSIGIKA